MLFLGDMYEKGVGVEQNYLEALMLYNKAAKSGNLNAKTKLCELYKKMS